MTGAATTAGGVTCFVVCMCCTDTTTSNTTSVAYLVIQSTVVPLCNLRVQRQTLLHTECGVNYSDNVTLLLCAASC